MNFSFINRRRYSLLNAQKIDEVCQRSVFKYLNTEKTKGVLILGVFFPLLYFLKAPNINPDVQGLGGFVSAVLLGMILSLLLFLVLIGLEKSLLWWRGLSSEMPYNHRFSNKNKIKVLEKLEQNRSSFPPSVFTQIIKTLTDESPSDHWWWQLNMIVNQKSGEAKIVEKVQVQSLQNKIRQIDDQVVAYDGNFEPIDNPIGLSIDKNPDQS